MVNNIFHRKYIGRAKWWEKLFLFFKKKKKVFDFEYFLKHPDCPNEIVYKTLFGKIYIIEDNIYF